MAKKKSEKKKNGETSIGLDENLAGAISYIPILGLIFLFVEKKSSFVRFHSIQSILLQIGSYLLVWIPLLWPIAWAIQLILIFILLFGAYQAYSNNEYKFPIVGDIADKQKNNFPS